MKWSPIGYVRSPFKTRFGVPRQSQLSPLSHGSIEILPRWQPELSLSGLEECSHIWVLFWFHQNPQDKKFRAKVRPPRLKGGSIGLFASRSPFRPNPIGLSLVNVESVEGDRIWVSGIDCVDGTPVIDIKPYLSEVEACEVARLGWVDDHPCRSGVVQWTEEALTQLTSLAAKSSSPQEASMAKGAIEELLQADPRPQRKRQAPCLSDQYVMAYRDWDVWFSAREDDEGVSLVVLKVCPSAISLP